MRSSGDDPVAVALEHAAALIADDIRSVTATNPVVLIDGQSGAGKTTLARKVAERWPIVGRVQVIALDSVYPGWDGLRDGVELVLDGVLRPHGRGNLGAWSRWDWAAGAPAESHGVDPALGLLIEGSGILTPDTAAIADVRIWIDSPERHRKDRALRRDGDTYRPHWDRWALQEANHISRDDPRSLATRIISVP